MQTEIHTFEENVKRAIRAAMALGYTVRHNPYNPDVTWPPMKSVKPAPVKTWFVPSVGMNEAVSRALPTMDAGVVKQLMAGTAAGKTTALPLHLTATLQMGIVVLVPFVGLSQHVARYVQQIAVTFGLKDAVYELSSDASKSTGKVPALYYASIGEFTAQLCYNPKLLTDLSVSLIMLDESHVTRPEYIIFNRLIAGSDIFTNVKLLFASATATGASDVSREDTSKRTLVQIPGEIKPGTLPDQHPADSPFHHANVNSRTMMFLADDRQFPQWLEYFTQHDIPAMGYGYCDRVSNLKHIEKFFQDNNVCVLLTTSVIETGFTYAINVVLDDGQVLTPRWNPAQGKYMTVRERVTKAVAIQRAGRAGRIILGGIAYQHVGGNGIGIHEVDPENAQVVYLWSRMFNMHFNDPKIAVFEQFFGKLSLEMIGTLLTCAFPPVIACSYIADDGVFSGWERAFKVLMSTANPIPRSNQDNGALIRDWGARTIPSFDPEQPGVMDYKSKLELSWPYDVIACYMWGMYQDSTAEEVSDTVTIYRGGTTKRVASRRRPSKPLSPPPVPEVPKEFKDKVAKYVARADTVFTVGKDIPKPRNISAPKKPATEAYSSEDDDVEEVVRDFEPPATLLREVTPAVAKAHIPMYGETSRVQSWSDKSSSSNGNVEAADLKKIRHPSKHWRELLFPYDADLLGRFNDDQSATRTDARRYKDLLAGSKEFATLSRDTSELRRRQTEYVLSMLRIHRAALLGMMQASVGMDEKRRSLLQVLFGGEDSKADHYAKQARYAAGFLEMTITLGYEYAVNKRKHHSASGVDVIDLRRLRNLAKFALEHGPVVVVQRVAALAEFRAPFPLRASWGTMVIAQAWSMNNRLFAPLHAYQDLTEGVQKRWTVDTSRQVSVEDEDTVVFCDASDACPWRKPVDKEYVYLARYDPVTSQMCTYGFSMTHVGSQDIAYVQCSLVKGYSGSLVVSATDGYILGMYIGQSQLLEGVVYSRYVTSNMIFS